MLIFCYFFTVVLFTSLRVFFLCDDFRLSFFSVLPQVAGLQICHLPRFFPLAFSFLFF